MGVPALKVLMVQHNLLRGEAGRLRDSLLAEHARKQADRLRAKLEKMPPYPVGANGFADPGAFVRSILSEYLRPDLSEFHKRSQLRLLDAARRANPLHDAHVREYKSAIPAWGRRMVSCKKCGTEGRQADWPKDAGGRIKDLCAACLHDFYDPEARKRRAIAQRKRADRVIHNRISREMWASMKGRKGGRKWQKILGYTTAELVAHLGRMLPRGYTVQRCIQEGWHIDHIVPKSAFDCTTIEGVKQAWCLSNLRIIPAEDNIRKGDRMDFLL